MKTFRVAIDVKRSYTVEIQAESEKEALRLANEMSSTDIAEQGELDEVETDAIIAFPPGELFVSGDATVDPKFHV